VLVALLAVVVLAGCVPVAAPAPRPVATTTSTTVPPLSEPARLFPCPAPTSSPTRVILYGDSLAREAAAEFTAQLCAPTVEVLTRTQPGAALCDFTTLIESEADALAPDIVLIQFSGNRITPCVSDGQGAPLAGAALWARYESDAESIAAFFDTRAVDVAWVAPPGVVGGAEPPLRAVFERVVAAHLATASIIDGGVGLRDATGIYRLEVPCLPEEAALSSCFQGQITVRLPIDGFHFCPVLAPDACPAYNAGAVRFGRALANPVRTALGI